MNHKSVGEVSEAVVLAELIKMGYTVLIPFGDNQRYDLAIDNDGILLRIQVKTAWQEAEKGRLVFRTCSHNPFTNKMVGYVDQADFFAIYSPDTEKIYWIPVSMAPKRVMYLRVKTSKNNQRAKVVWAHEYEFMRGSIPSAL